MRENTLTAIGSRHRDGWNNPRRLLRTIICVLSFFCVVITLVACGKRPARLDPPPSNGTDSGETNGFPARYPRDTQD